MHAARSKRLPSGAPSLDTTAMDQLSQLFAQTLQQARQQSTFDLTAKNWLEWSCVQRARCAAERAHAALGEKASAAAKLRVTRECALLMCLTHQPPDRVGILRLLQLGGTLKKVGSGGFALDLSLPGAHKTSAVLGPSKTTVPPPIARWLRAYIALAAIPDGGYLFYQGDDVFAPLPSPQWTRTVKAVMKRWSGVPMAPKDLRWDARI